MNGITDQKMMDQLLLIRNLIQERNGLFFRDYHGLEVLAARLTPRLKLSGCGSFSEYYRLLRDGGIDSANEWLHVAASLSKPKSSFLRHANRVRCLVNSVIPEFILNGIEPLRIWSAACSTGEEPLTIAMALTEAGWFDRIQIELYASDASFKLIERARRGLYSEIRTTDLSPEFRSKYFTRVNEGWEINPEVHSRIKWSVRNLMNETEIAEFSTSHIIFCCNVFIYFSPAGICQTLRRFGKRMPAGGYLFTDEGDYFESLMSEVRLFEQQRFSGGSMWKRIEIAH